MFSPGGGARMTVKEVSTVTFTGKEVRDMRRNDYEKVCSAVDAGIDRFVENVETGEIGRIVACKRDRLQVDIYGRSENWEKENCELKTQPTYDLPR